MAFHRGEACTRFDVAGNNGNGASPESGAAGSTVADVVPWDLAVLALAALAATDLVGRLVASLTLLAVCAALAYRDADRAGAAAVASKKASTGNATDAKEPRSREELAVKARIVQLEASMDEQRQRHAKLEQQVAQDEALVEEQRALGAQERKRRMEMEAKLKQDWSGVLALREEVDDLKAESEDLVRQVGHAKAACKEQDMMVSEARLRTKALRLKTSEEEVHASRRDAVLQSRRDQAESLQDCLMTAQVEADWSQAKGALLMEEFRKLRERWEQGSVVTHAAEAMGSFFGLGATSAEELFGAAFVPGRSPGAVSPEMDAAHRRAVRRAAELAAELSDLQHHAGQVQRQKDGLQMQCSELECKTRHLANALVEKKQMAERHQQMREAVQEALTVEQSTLLRLRKEVEDARLRRRSPEEAIDQLGDMLLRTLRSAPPSQRAGVKKKLLLCFHPDKNPAMELATRITQILNRS